MQYLLLDRTGNKMDGRNNERNNYTHKICIHIEHNVDNLLLFAVWTFFYSGFILEKTKYIMNKINNERNNYAHKIYIVIKPNVDNLLLFAVWIFFIQDLLLEKRENYVDGRNNKSNERAHQTFILYQTQPCKFAAAYCTISIQDLLLEKKGELI